MWIQPKTNWQPEDYFNIDDYNRIKGNLNELKSLALVVWPNVPFEEMGADKMYSDYGFYADEINRFEMNVDHIRDATVPLEMGEKQTFYENQSFIDWKELNRIETAWARMYQYIHGSSSGVPRMTFILDNARIGNRR